ncbi:hypothetical protein ACQ4PT_050186 [Festuca glaucescens]
MSLSNSAYLFSSTKNGLVALGCPNLGYFVDANGYYVSGCMSVCRPSQYAMPGPCTGVGCCKSAIPPGIDFFEPYQRNFPKGQDDSSAFTTNATSCHYVFLVDTEWFTYSDRVFLDRADDFEVPVVLDWAVRNVGACSAAKGNATADFACRSAHSDCFDVENRDGYRCSCSTGYDGNPYLDNGCIGVGVGVILLGSISCGTCLALQKSNLMRTKKKFFEHNGGVILQQQMRSGNRSLVSCFVTAVKAGRHDELMDGNVRKEMGPEALEEVTHLLMRCMSMSGDERPGMKEVAERLEALRRG